MWPHPQGQTRHTDEDDGAVDTRNASRPHVSSGRSAIVPPLSFLTPLLPHVVLSAPDDHAFNPQYQNSPFSDGGLYATSHTQASGQAQPADAMVYAPFHVAQPPIAGLRTLTLKPTPPGYDVHSHSNNKAGVAVVQPKRKRKVRICTTDGCDKLVVDRGVCIRHGGGKRCNVEGCTSRAQHKGLCWKHGGYTLCQVEGCTKRAKSRGVCWSHGGGTRCTTDDCEKIAVSRGRCWAHGGGKRCKLSTCQKPAALRMDDYCAEHYASALPYRK